MTKRQSTNHEMSERFQTELSLLSSGGAKSTDELKHFAAAAERAGAALSTGSISRYGQNSGTGTMVYFKKDNAGTYGSPWPAWAYELAKTSMLYGRKIMILSNGDPMGSNLLTVYVTDTLVGSG